MRELPILFTDAMIAAIEAGSKTQTRRLKVPNWEPGDVLYARHAWAPGEVEPIFRVDEPLSNYRWRPGMFMPKEIARVWLRVVAIRAERLMDITRDDAIAEGLQRLVTVEGRLAKGWRGTPELRWRAEPVEAYLDLWDSIRSAGAAAADPLVYVTTFAPVERPA